MAEFVNNFLLLAFKHGFAVLGCFFLIKKKKKVQVELGQSG